jgi:two-component system sensor kinase FixL
MLGDGRHNGSASPITVSDVQLASVLDTAVDGIVVIDELSTILMFNKACEQMFGYDSAEVIGRNISMLMPAEDAEPHDAYMEAYKATGRRQIIGTGREVQGRRKDGSLFPLELSVGEADTPEGPQFIGILRDASGRKEAERRYVELQSEHIRLTRISALDEMGLAIAHELNQPLTAILLYLQAVGRELKQVQDTGDTAKASSILDKVRREAQRAGSIIQRLRQLAEKRAPERRSTDFNAIVEDAVDLTLIGHERQVRVVRDYQDDLPVLEIDQVQIQQVVVNLVRNAFEAVRDRRNAEVVVSTALDERHVLLSVADNGPGIPSDKLTDLFQAFKTGKRNGMGLGLAISRTIVQSHGGELLVDPGGHGRGARFVVRLPLPGDNDISPGISAIFAEEGHHPIA